MQMCCIQAVSSVLFNNNNYYYNILNSICCGLVAFGSEYRTVEEELSVDKSHHRQQQDTKRRGERERESHSFQTKCHYDHTQLRCDSEVI